jgi:uncharacterized iron-regulated membrane protein
VVKIGPAVNLDQAVDVSLSRGDEIKNRLFDPRSGNDLGDSVPTGIWVVSKLIDLHDNLLAGPTGRRVNGVGALALLALAVTGLAIWWAGHQDMASQPDATSRQRLTWNLHGMVGFWSLGFILVFA